MNIYFDSFLRNKMLIYRPIIENAASSNDNAFAYRGNSGELHSREANGANLP